MVLAGNYWYFNGFDVTNSQDAEKGIVVAGNNNTLEDIRTYKNGNTGIQISRYKGTDNFDEWPANNLILNCTSYLNADRGYEDADGFAAKLTVAEGNVFDGCISAFNADDGWDLYAKVQSGSIGKVVIKNSVAFMNGYVIKDGAIVNAGNGNGFKMGGESLSGHHTLINSVAFANKAKGIDSNSCPDIEVYNSTAFDNESYNVAFYTNNAINTDFSAEGVLSYKKSNTVAEQLKFKGTQDENKVRSEKNYYVTGKEASANSVNEAVSEDWFVSLDKDLVVNAAIEAIANGTFGLKSDAVTGIVRNSDNTINMNGFLVLTANAPEGVGARLNEAPVVDEPVDEPSEEPSVKPETNKKEEFIKDVVETTNKVTENIVKNLVPETTPAPVKASVTEVVKTVVAPIVATVKVLLSIFKR